MKAIFTRTTLKYFAIIYCCVWGFNILLAIINADFDLTEQVSPRSLLFNILVSTFITLLMITRHKKPVQTNA